MKFTWIILLLFVYGTTLAQEGEHKHKHELGVAISPSYLVNEKNWATSIHAHFISTIKDSKWGLGPSYEWLSDEHKHQTVGIAVQYTPFNHWHNIISPGITGENGFSEVRWAVHFETTYGFQIHDHIHLGPVAEVAIDEEDSHISIGIHLGLGF